MRKLRARSMPPAGRPRPTEAAYDGLVAHLETSLDRVAAANPDPGRTDTFRRLNRTEYQNAIRDLLGARGRRRDASAERRLEPWVRQHQRRRPVADAARAISVGRAENQPPCRGNAGALGRRRDHRSPAGPDAGRSLRRAAVRHARRHERAVHVSGRRRISVRASPHARSQRADRGADRAASDGGQRRRRAAAGVHVEAGAANADRTTTSRRSTRRNRRPMRT